MMLEQLPKTIHGNATTRESESTRPILHWTAISKLQEASRVVSMPLLKRKRPRIRKPSSPFVKITYFDNEGVRGAFDCYIAELVAKRPDVTRVVLFGSVARGDAVPGSDVDLLIVLTSADKPFLNRMAEFMPDRFPVGIDVFP